MSFFQSRLLIILVNILLVNQPVLGCKNTVHLNMYAKPGSDVTEVLQRLVTCYQIVIIDEGEWLLSGSVQLRSGVTIKGVGADKSILKRSGLLISGPLFFTEKVNTDIYTNKNFEDDYNDKRIKYNNIVIENLSINFNRPSSLFSSKEVASKNLYGIALIKTANAVVRYCYFTDGLTIDHNNGYPAIVVFQSKNIKVQKCVSENVSFIQVIYSKKVEISSNHCKSSVGTAIEFIAGMDHNCQDNKVENVLWKVSCVGINSRHCQVKDNVIIASVSNTSCLTLGHESSMFRSDNTVVSNNKLYSEGVRSIFIQNGNSLKIKDNDCICIIGKNAPELTSGCIVAYGSLENIYNINITGNTLTATGTGNRGCITYGGKGSLVIMSNTINANRGIGILSSSNCDVEIVGNYVNSIDYAVTANCPKLLIKGNTLQDGIIANSIDIVISKNNIGFTSHGSVLGKRWERIVIEDNSLENHSGIIQESGFLLDGSDKTEDFDERRVRVQRNSVKRGIVKEMIVVSGAKAVP